MAQNDIYDYNDAGEMAVRVVQATAGTQAITNSQSCYMYDENGNLAVRVIGLGGGGGGGGSTPTAAEVSFDPANLSIITGTNVQSALQQVDTSLNGMVKIAQGTGNTGNVLAVDGSGNVVPTAGYATQSWVETQITKSIGSIESALAEV